MKKDVFIEEIKKELEKFDLISLKDFAINVCDKIPSNLYEMILCNAKEKNGNLLISYEEIDSQRKLISEKFKEIEDGNICFQCYSYETGRYDGYGDSDYDYQYSSTKEMNNILLEAFNFGKKMIFYKKYYYAIEIFELILYTNYLCEEYGDPEYDNSDEIYDEFEVDIEDLKNELPFNYNDLYLYCIYATLMDNSSNRNKKLYQYLSENPYVKIEDSLNMGIEKISNFESFYKKFIEYLKKSNDKKSIEILKRMNID